MKKFSILVLAGALCAASAAPGFASLLRNDFTALEGPVLEKKEATKELTVRNNSNGNKQVFIAEDAQLSSVKVGDTVLILHQIDSNAIGTMVVTQPK